MSYDIRTAVEADAYQLSQIEHEAFSTSPPTPFLKHIRTTTNNFIVAYQDPPSCPQGKHTERLEGGVGPMPDARVNIMTRIWHQLVKLRNRGPGSTQTSDYIGGYVATSYAADEAHITGIAVRKSLRGMGMGELLLMSSLRTAVERQMRIVTLEVRVSNHVAQSLYKKYGFSEAGLRKRYYSDNHEDAYIMTTDTISSVEYQELLDGLTGAFKKRPGFADTRNA